MKRILICLLLSISASLQAAINLGQTRLIFEENNKAATLEVNNNVDAPYMVQSWLDKGDPEQTPANLPMIVTPPILKLDGRKSAMLRVLYQGNGLPENKESVLWLNVQEIPQANTTANGLQLAQRIRIKVFYRPASLNMTLSEAVEKLQWRCTGNNITVDNPTPLHISLASLHFSGRNMDIDMVNPYAQRTFSLPQAVPRHVAFTWINDYGGQTRVDNVACHL